MKFVAKNYLQGYIKYIFNRYISTSTWPWPAKGLSSPDGDLRIMDPAKFLDVSTQAYMLLLLLLSLLLLLLGLIRIWRVNVIREVGYHFIFLKVHTHTKVHKIDAFLRIRFPEPRLPYVDRVK